MESQADAKKLRTIQLIGWTAALVLLVLGLYFLKKQHLIPGVGERPRPEQPATTTVEIGGITFELPPGASIETISRQDVGPAPKLNRPVHFPAYFTDDAKLLWEEKWKIVRALLAKDPYSYEAWLEAGLLLQMVEDFKGTAAAWEYTAKLWPNDGVVFANLGFLYGYYLKDAPKAEVYYRKAINNAPKSLQMYQQTFEFYRDVMKSPAKARAVAEEGKQATGNSAFFDGLLSSL